MLKLEEAGNISTSSAVNARLRMKQAKLRFLRDPGIPDTSKIYNTKKVSNIMFKGVLGEPALHLPGHMKLERTKLERLNLSAYVSNYYNR